MSARRESVLRPEFGPTLPQLLRARLGVPPRVTAVLALLVVAGGIVFALSLRGGEIHYVRSAAPAFNLRYAPVLHRAPPRPGVLFELDARRGSTFLQSLTIRPLRLPAYRGAVSGLFPIYAEGRKRELQRASAGFVALDEGKTRIHDAPGYQVSFRARLGARTVYGRDVLVVPETPGAREGVIMTLLQTHAAGAHSIDDVGAVGALKKPFRSFFFGTEGR